MSLRKAQMNIFSIIRRLAIRKKKIQREREEERKEQYEAMLHKIWELEQQEKKQNIIDRDRLRF